MNVDFGNFTVSNPHEHCWHMRCCYCGEPYKIVVPTATTTTTTTQHPRSLRMTAQQGEP